MLTHLKQRIGGTEVGNYVTNVHPSEGEDRLARARVAIGDGRSRGYTRHRRRTNKLTSAPHGRSGIAVSVRLANMVPSRTHHSTWPKELAARHEAVCPRGLEGSKMR